MASIVNICPCPALLGVKAKVGIMKCAVPRLKMGKMPQNYQNAVSYVFLSIDYNAVETYLLCWPEIPKNTFWAVPILKERSKMSHE